jgi:hypothetical protein
MQQSAVKLVSIGPDVLNCKALPLVRATTSAVARSHRADHGPRCGTSLPISIPITAIALLSLSDMACSLTLGPPGQPLLLAGLEHGRTIPLPDISVGRARRRGIKQITLRSDPFDAASRTCNRSTARHACIVMMLRR